MVLQPVVTLLDGERAKVVFWEENNSQPMGDILFQFKSISKESL
jgi:hypothetical protein